MKIPFDPSQLRAEAKGALLRRRFGIARTLLDEALTLAPRSYKLHRLRGVAAACMGDWNSALGAPSPALFCGPPANTPASQPLARGLASHPCRPATYVCLCAVDAQAVTELAPSLVDGHYHKGCALQQLQDHAGAVRGVAAM